MPTITVLDKLYGSGSPETFEKIYSRLVSGLKVQLRFADITNREWVQIEVSGQDQTAALSFLNREIRLAPVSLSNLEKFSVIRGKVIFSSKSERELNVDIGVFSPQVCDAVLPVQRLQSQLADGKELPLKQLVELFCIYDNLPLEVKLVQNVDDQSKTVEANLSEAQVSLFNRWFNSRFDRLIIFGSTFSDVERALKFSRHSRDIIKTESLGILEQVILCKMGTDAVGLIPKLGCFLKSAVLVPFSPKKILEAFNGQSF